MQSDVALLYTTKRLLPTEERFPRKRASGICCALRRPLGFADMEGLLAGGAIRAPLLMLPAQRRCTRAVMLVRRADGFRIIGMARRLNSLAACSC